MTVEAFTVTELNKYIKGMLDSDAILAKLAVRGELSNYRLAPTGHHYFTMKDSESAIKCVLFKGSASKLRFKLENGMSAVAFGNVSVYLRDGHHQLIVSEIEPDGVGALYFAYEQLKDKLSKEGLFDDKHKKELPRMPKSIAVITSSVGAAVRDIIRILNMRWPMTKVIVLPVRVQGVEAPPEIASAIAFANRHSIADLIVVGRGGGAIEDLWAFNDEGVVRAIFASEIPVISAVGHQTDVTISDFVADLRAATPSNAAELAVPDINDVRDGIRSMQIRLRQAISSELRSKRHEINTLSEKRVIRNPGIYIDEKRQQIDRLYESMLSHTQRKIYTMRQRIILLREKSVIQNPKAYVDGKRMVLNHSRDRLYLLIQGKVNGDKGRFGRLAAILDAMSPLRVLGRGYAIAKGEDGIIIKSASDVNIGDKVKLRLYEDEINCRVIESEE